MTMTRVTLDEEELAAAARKRTFQSGRLAGFSEAAEIVSIGCEVGCNGRPCDHFVIAEHLRGIGLGMSREASIDAAILANRKNVLQKVADAKRPKREERPNDYEWTYGSAVQQRIASLEDDLARLRRAVIVLQEESK